jgi:hypothetical protein
VIEAAAAVSADLVNDVVPLLGISHFFILSTLGEPQKGRFMIVQYLKLIDVVYNLGVRQLILPPSTSGN